MRTTGINLPLAVSTTDPDPALTYGWEKRLAITLVEKCTTFPGALEGSERITVVIGPGQ